MSTRRDSSLSERVFTPRAALLANLGLVFAGSVLGLLNLVDTLVGVVIVLTGALGASVVLLESRRS
ncbi:hypothetical protein OB905_09670 [Halobacteria archaeon AArc-dxtr1]|nr:hypothetical protein [Halobacteria archaeon AArc-dxtr1]